ncbi:MAG: hypothetical protein AAF840_18435, partial [Bacteroidota bacterium]
MSTEFQRYRPAIPPNFQESFRLYLLEELDKISQSFSSLADAELGSIASTDDLAEGSTNFYFTNERVDDQVASLLTAGNNITLTYNDIAGTLTIDSAGGGGSALSVADEGLQLNPAVDSIDFVGAGVSASAVGSAVTVNIPGGPADTDALSEGSTNLYFTDERVDDRVAALLTAGTNVTLTYDDGANTLTIDAAGGSSAPAGSSQSFIAEESATISTSTAGGF